jgi:hypothetical protein
MDLKGEERKKASVEALLKLMTKYSSNTYRYE